MRIRSVLLAASVAVPLAGCVSSESVRVPGTAAGSPETVLASLTKPEGAGPFPAVVLLPACGGSARQHVATDWPAFLQKHGFVAMTVNSYGSRGYLECSDRPRRVWPFHQAVDAYSALDYLAGLPYVDGHRVAVMGFSAGGFAINEHIIAGMFASRTNEFKAAIAVYAGCFRLDGYAATLESPIKLLQIAAEHDERLVGSCVAAASHGPMDLHVIKGAYHAFDQSEIYGFRYDNAGNPMRYSWAATKEARQVALDFLRRNL